MNVESFPEKPIHLPQIDTLEEHEKIRCTHVVYTLGPNDIPDFNRATAFTIYFERGHGKLLLFDPFLEEWEVVTGVDGDHDPVMNELEDAKERRIENEQRYGEALAYKFGEASAETLEEYDPSAHE